MSDWGKGHENNDIGFGQANVSSTNSFGDAYITSESGDTILYPAKRVLRVLQQRAAAEGADFEAKYCLFFDLLTIDKQANVVEALTDTFKFRVQDDNGIFESELCLINTLKTIQ